MAQWIIAATGPSLTADVARQCNEAKAAGTHNLVAVNDAYKVLPGADLLYACDASWWTVHKGCPGFAGEKWTSWQDERPEKKKVIEQYGLKHIRGKHDKGFSQQPGLIHYGSTSGFQAVNLVLLMGCTSIVLVGFNMQSVGGKRHFFGDHPRPLNNHSNYAGYVRFFDEAAKMLPANVRIINATPDSAIKCFPVMALSEALATHANV